MLHCQIQMLLGVMGNMKRWGLVGGGHLVIRFVPVEGTVGLSHPLTLHMARW